MNFNKFFYGTDYPSLSKRHFMHVIWILLALFYYGYYSDFIPSESWSKYGSYASTIFSVVFTVFVWWLYRTKRTEFIKNTTRFIKFISLYIIFPLLIFGFSWVAIIHGAPSLITRIAGTQEKSIVVLTKEQSTSKYSCNHKLIGKFLEKAFPSHLCINQHFFEQSPDRLEVELIGYKTQFGFLVDSFRDYK